MVDGPSLHGDTALGRPVGDSDVVAFGRDLQVSYRVWSPKSGYPGPRRLPRLPHLRPRHRPQAGPGHRTQRAVGGQGALRPASAPTPPSTRHVADFVEVVRRRLIAESERIGRPAHVVAAFDTELFGHWWYEGPLWLERVLRALPEAGVRVGTLSRRRRATASSAHPVELPPSSWGSGKDWQVWAGEQVADLVQLNTEVVDTALTTVDKALDADRSARRTPATSSPTRSCARRC